MKLSSKLHLVAVLPLVMAAAASAIFFLWSERIQKVQDEALFAEALIRQVFNLELMRDDFVATRDPAVRRRWLAAYDELGGQVHAGYRFTNAKERTLLERIAALHRDIGPLISQLDEPGETEANPGAAASFRAKTAEMMEHASVLAELNQADLRKIWNNLLISTFLYLFGAAAVIGVISFAGSRRLRRSIFWLERGTTRVAEGDTSFRIPVDGPQSGYDELEELAGAFNSMAGKVQRSHQELEDTAAALQAEVEVRLRAETALREMNRDLERLVGERTVEITHTNRLLEQARLHADRMAYQARTLAEEQREHRRRVLELLGVSKEVLRRNTLEGLLQAVVDAARRVTGARYAVSGHLSHEPGFRIDASSRAEASRPCPPGREFGVEKGGVYLEILEKKSVVRLTDEEMTRSPRWWGLPAGHAPLRGLLGAPLLGAEGECSGIIMVSDKTDGGDFTEEDEILLKELAEIASLGLAHVEGRSACAAAGNPSSGTRRTR